MQGWQGLASGVSFYWQIHAEQAAGPPAPLTVMLQEKRTLRLLSPDHNQAWGHNWRRQLPPRCRDFRPAIACFLAVASRSLITQSKGLSSPSHLLKSTAYKDSAELKAATFGAGCLIVLLEMAWQCYPRSPESTKERDSKVLARCYTRVPSFHSKVKRLRELMHSYHKAEPRLSKQ